MLTYTIPNSGLPMPIKIKTDVGFAILIKELPVLFFGQDEILCSQPIDMDQHSIKNVKNLIDRLDAVNKAYADRINIKQLLVIFLIQFWQTIYSSHFPLKRFCQWKDKNMWDVSWTVGRWVDSHIKSNVRNWVAWLSQALKMSVRNDIFLWFPC